MMRKTGPPSVIIATAYPAFALAAGFFLENLRSSQAGPRSAFLVRHYGRCLTEVDISFVRDMLLCKPAVLGFSCFFWNLDQNLGLAALAKTLHPDVFIVLGGPQVGSVSQAAGLLRQHPAVDAILCGEADQTFPELVRRRLAGKALQDLDGMVARKGDGIAAAKAPTYIRDLRELPLVFHEANDYVLTHLGAREPIPLQTLRGCRQKCSYCLYPAGGLRFFPLDRVERELAFLCRHRAKYVRVCDSHFGGTRERAMELFTMIKGVNADTTFTIYPDPAHLNSDYHQAADAANCRVISLGIESLDAGVLSRVGRKFSFPQFRRAFRPFRSRPEIPQLDVMFGLPGQTPESLRRDLVRLRLEGARRVLFSPLMVFPGTGLAAAPNRDGLTILLTPQGFGYSSGLGQAGYESLILVTEAYRLLERFPHADRYLRTALGTKARYATYCEAWLAAAAGPLSKELLDLSEQLRAGAAFIRAHQDSLTLSVVKFWEQASGLDGADPAVLTECVRLDLLEGAMQQRREELARDIHREPPLHQVFFPEDLLNRRWRLGEDSWLEVFSLPSHLAGRIISQPATAEANQVFCVYHCPSSKIFFPTGPEFRFLGRFVEPRLIFDVHHPYATKDFDMARQWIARGVLQNEGQ